jgi:predicted transcriptional regulator
MAKKQVTQSLLMDAELQKELKAYAKVNDRKVSEIIRLAVKAFLKAAKTAGNQP